MPPRRTRSSGNHIHVVIGEGSPKVTRVEREHRFAYELVNVSRYHASEAKKAGKNNFWRIRANVISSVTSSYAAIEAAYNEFLQVTALSFNSPLSDDKREVIYHIANEGLSPEPRQNTLQRFNMLLRILEKEELKPSTEPFQSANLLRSLRNLLVHPLPNTAVTFDLANPDLESEHEIAKRLRSTLKLKRNALFPEDVLIPECAVWASRSAERFLAAFEKRSDVPLGFILQTD